MFQMSRVLKNDRLMKSLTGMSLQEFIILSGDFEKVLYEHVATKPRKRKVGGGRKGTRVF